VPDIVIEQSEVTPSEQRFFKESDLPGHLENPNGAGKEKAEPKADKREDDLIRRDFQLYEAHTLLRGLSILSPLKKNTEVAE